MTEEMSVYEKFRCIVAGQFGIDEGQIIPTTDFQNDLGMNSLGLLDILMSIENEFEVEIDDINIYEYSYKLRSFQDAVDLIESAIRFKEASN